MIIQTQKNDAWKVSSIDFILENHWQSKAQISQDANTWIIVIYIWNRLNCLLYST
jgi:hypothetical protein